MNVIRQGIGPGDSEDKQLICVSKLEEGRQRRRGNKLESLLWSLLFSGGGHRPSPYHKQLWSVSLEETRWGRQDDLGTQEHATN